MFALPAETSAFPPLSAEWTFFLVAIVIVAGPLLAARLRLPGMIGLLLGGTLIGPNGLEWLERASVKGIGDIGLLFLMFMAGLELDLDDFARNRATALRFGGLTFALPFAAGIAVGAAAFGYGAAAAVLFGSLWASHTLVAYPIARDAGLTADPAVATAVGGTVITDTLALFVLAVVVGAHAGGSGVMVILGLVGGIALLLAVTLGVMPRVMRRVFATVATDRATRLVAVMCAFTGAAVLAHAVGLEGIVGAFFAGLAVNRLVPNRSPLMERLEFLGAAILVPFFLVSTGMLIDPAAFADGRTLALAGGSLAVVVGGKLLAAWIAGRSGGYSAAQIGLLFSLTVAQAAATLAAVIVGLEEGIFQADLVNAALVVVLVSLVVSSVGTARAASRLPARPAGPARIGATVLVPLTGDAGAARLEVASRLAAADGGVVVAMGVAAPSTPDALSAARARAERAVAGVHGLAAEAEIVTRVDDHVEQAVLWAAQEHDASVVVAGLPGALEAWAAIAGGGRDAVFDDVRLPVLVVAEGAAPPRRVVLAVDGRDLRRPGELALAARVAERLTRGGAAREPGLLLVPGDTPEDVLGLWPEARVERHDRDLPAALREVARPDDLVVVPTALGMSALDAAVLRATRLDARPTVVAVAAPAAPSERSARVLASGVGAPA